MATATSVRKAPPEAIHAEPVAPAPIKWFAALGVGFLLMAFYVFSAWFISGNFTRTPPGPTPLPDWMRVSLIAWQIIAPVCFVAGLWLFVIRPYRRDRQLSSDGLIYLSLCTLYWMDMLCNSWKVWIVYNAHMVQFGSWANFLPTWTVPRGNQFSEPLLFEPFVWSVFVLPGMVFGCWMIRKMKARWPNASYVKLFGGLVLILAAVDVLFEGPWIRFGLYSFPGSIRWLTLWPGKYYQFPLHEAAIWGICWTGLTALRYFKDDKGRTIVERGADRVGGSGKRQTVVRFLALTGGLNMIFLVGYYAPWMITVQSSKDPWPADVVNRSYFTNNMCGFDTGIACPTPANPIPTEGSGRVAPDGRYIPAP